MTLRKFEDGFEPTADSRKSWLDKQNTEIRDFLQPPAPPHCISSLSILSGLSLGSRVVRPCQLVKSGTTGMSTRRTTPSTLLQHGYDWISDEDQKILNMMVMRREAQIEEEDLSMSARNLWEKDRISYNKAMNEKQKQWNEYVKEKRRLEKMELERRKEGILYAQKRQIAELEERIHERHKMCQLRHSQMLYNKRIIKIDRDEVEHKLRREQIEQEEQLRSNLHISLVQAKERRVADNLNAIIKYRDRAIKERSFKRDQRIEAAQQLREVLNERYADWCEENKRLLSSKLCLCEYRASKNIEWKRRKTFEKNQMKRLQHSITISQLRDEERAKEYRARQELDTKENRIRHVQERKEQIKTKSRMNALITANLRQKIKASYHLTG